MSLPKIEQLFPLDDLQIEQEILAAKKELFDLRLKKSTNQSFTSHSFRHIKHRIGQLKMILKQRQGEASKVRKKKKRG